MKLMANTQCQHGDIKVLNMKVENYLIGAALAIGGLMLTTFYVILVAIHG